MNKTCAFFLLRMQKAAVIAHKRIGLRRLWRKSIAMVFYVCIRVNIGSRGLVQGFVGIILTSCRITFSVVCLIPTGNVLAPNLRIDEESMGIQDGKGQILLIISREIQEVAKYTY